MSGSGGQGKWMASSVKEKDITELRAAGYLAKEIAHHLPAKGQFIPSPRPNERVVFIPHFCHDRIFGILISQKAAFVLTSPRITVS